MTRLLVTGFGPFPGVRANPSATLARRLFRDKRLTRNGVVAAARFIPTTWTGVDAVAHDLLSANPDLLIMLGVAGRRRGLSVELRARNRVSMFPDANGRRKAGVLIDAGNLPERGALADVDRLVASASGYGVGVRRSRNAGAYLCNYAYWRMLAALPSTTRCVFIHLPRKCRLSPTIRALVAVALELARQRRELSRSTGVLRSPGCGGGSGSS